MRGSKIKQWEKIFNSYRILISWGISSFSKSIQSVLFVTLCCLTDTQRLCKQTSVILCKEKKTSGI